MAGRREQAATWKPSPGRPAGPGLQARLGKARFRRRKVIRDYAGAAGGAHAAKPAKTPPVADSASPRPVSLAPDQPEPAMPIVALYQFRAHFPVKPEFERLTPDGTLARKGLLLLRQAGEGRFDAEAIAACETAGATNVQILRHAPLDLVALQRPQNKAFAVQYETALREGHALTIYDTPLAGDPLAQSDGGFSPSDRTRH